MRLPIFFVAILSAGVAQAADNATTARNLFNEGRALLDDGNYARACPKLAESVQLDAKLAVRLALASCYERAGRTGSAWAEFKEVAAAAAKAGDSEWQREAYALDRVKDLEKKLVRVNIVVKDKTPGLSVRRNGVLVPPAQLGVPEVVDPGSIVISAFADGYEPFSQKIDVAKEPVTTVEIPALRKSEPPKTEPVPPPPIS